MYNIQEKGGVTGYNLKHTGLPEAIIPAGSTYKVAKVDKIEDNHYVVTLYSKDDKIKAREITEKPPTKKPQDRLKRDSDGKVIGVWSKKKNDYMPYLGDQKLVDGKWVTTNTKKKKKRGG